MNTLFKPIRPKKLSEEIVEQIQARISDGQLKPGEQIPSERELASILGVSRPSVREAIMMLEAMGILEAKQGGGTYVRSLTETSLARPLTEMVEKNPKLLKDLLEVRIGLECWSAYLAATRATDEDLEKIGAIVEKMGRTGKKGWDPEDDTDLHYAIATATHNTMQIHVLNSIHGLYRATIEVAMTRFYSQPKYIKMLYNQHKEIYKNIATRNPEGAMTAMKNHLEWVKDILPRIVEKGAE
jgi:GntR family transcriptional repressor for pyruvate dehydrogenase complex